MSGETVTHRQPRNEKQAAELLERYAVLEGKIGAVESVRNAAIANVNATADAEASPLLKERDDIVAKLQPWWTKAGPTLTKGKRKSIELGGCEIGSVSSRAKLGIEGDEKEIAAALQKRKWAADLLRTTVSIDKAAVFKVIAGQYKRQLAELGFSRVEGAETFYVKRVEQTGTLAGAEA